MKPLQNNFTTPEQSKRLLELGLPADSADCALEDNGGIIEIIPLLDKKLSAFQKEMNRFEEENDYPRFVTYIPCWSVGRLIEIELTCREQRKGQVARLTFYAEDMPSDLSATNIVECLIAYMERGEFKYDFSKLED